MEDVAALRSVICRQLEAAGYAVESAADGLAALDILASATRKIDAVISDVMMPVLGGYELEEALRERYPHVRCLLMTGHAPHELDNARAHVALRKPFRAEQLRQAVAALWDDEDRDGYGAL